jgi:translation initiation factor 1 (eIF-1/SUI1)
MVKVNQVITHMDRDKSYYIVLKERHGLVVVFGLTPLADAWWGADRLQNKSDSEIYLAQRQKAQNPLVMSELVKIRDLALRHNIPRESILMIEESKHSVEELASKVRQSFGTGGAVSDVSAMLPLLSNRVGQALTQILVDEVWQAPTQSKEGNGV